MLRFNQLIITIGLTILVSLCFYLRKVKHKDYVYLTFFSVLFIYLMYVLKYTLFPIPVQTQQVYVINYNLIPFRLDPYTKLLGREVLLNILLSVPFGFGISYIHRVNKKKILFYGLGFGAVIESTQFIISYLIGYSYRVFDVNDLIFNFSGVIVGYTSFLVFTYVLTQLTTRFEFLRNNFLVNYILSPVQVPQVQMDKEIQTIKESMGS